jgi:hypothetical protein
MVIVAISDAMDVCREPLHGPTDGTPDHPPSEDPEEREVRQSQKDEEEGSEGLRPQNREGQQCADDGDELG